MSNLDPKQIANINSLRSYVDSTHDLSIVQKTDLVRKLNEKKNLMATDVTKSLRRCKDTGNAIYNKWMNHNDADRHDMLEQYHESLKEHHDAGSELINHINAANNFEQLNKIETEKVVPFFASTTSLCNSVPTIVSESIETNYVEPVVSVPTPIIKPAPVVKTTTVHAFTTPQPNYRSPKRVVPMVPDRYGNLRPATQAQMNRARNSNVLNKPLSVVPVVHVGGGKFQPAPPKRVPFQKAVVTHDYASSVPGTLTLKENTLVNIYDYEGDWARIKTQDGHTGYASRHFLRPL